MKSRTEIKNGVILSYLLIFINMMYGLLITPFILKYVGTVDYGVYKSVASLSASLAVLDLGLCATMTRYMSKYNAENDRENASNFAAMIMVQFMVLAGAIACLGIVFVISLDTIYAATFSAEAMHLARKLLVFLLLNMVLRLFENLLIGIANGYEHFTLSNGVRIAALISKILLILVVLPINHNIVAIVALETVITLLATAVLIVYIIRKIGIVPRLKRWDKRLFRESFGYTGLMFLQTLTVQFNGNVDNILIGARLGAVSVTVYSVALQLFGMYETLSGSIANIMLPNISKRIAMGQTSAELQQVVEKCGRMQFMILGAALGGFIVLGKDFFLLWLGPGYQDSYYIALMLMIPVTFTMMQNVTLSILRARNKMVYRTVTLMVSCLINIVVSVTSMRYIGYWGTALGTVASTVCNLVFMNTYYHVKLDFKILSLFAHILHRIAPCAITTTAVVYCVHSYFHGTWVSFIINAALYIVIYVALLLCWGLEKEEKHLLLGYAGVRRNRK